MKDNMLTGIILLIANALFAVWNLVLFNMHGSLVSLIIGVFNLVVTGLISYRLGQMCELNRSKSNVR